MPSSRVKATLLPTKKVPGKAESAAPPLTLKPDTAPGTN
jgi:hypothetical protein